MSKCRSRTPELMEKKGEKMEEREEEEEEEEEVVEMTRKLTLTF